MTRGHWNSGAQVVSKTRGRFDPSFGVEPPPCFRSFFFFGQMFKTIDSAMVLCICFEKVNNDFRVFGFSFVSKCRFWGSEHADRQYESLNFRIPRCLTHPIWISLAMAMGRCACTVFVIVTIVSIFSSACRCFFSIAVPLVSELAVSA